MAQGPRVQVTAEESVYAYVSPNNGSGPLWCYGCSVVARCGEVVVASQMETGEGVPLLCNTRWKLLRRAESAWGVAAETEGYRQREPCPVAVTSEEDVFLYVNDSTRPPGEKYGLCEPHLLKFSSQETGAPPVKIAPVWGGDSYFTDHSYRGFGADRARAQLLMLNIDARTSIQHACLLSSEGRTLATGSITFPIRACYPQVALRDGAVHVLAISDIVEPVEEWRAYKHKQTGRDWDYVFRILYYTRTHDLATTDFSEPIEIANVDATGGHISNQDLWLGPDGVAYVMYTERQVASALLRDKFFPDGSTINSLHLAVVRDAAIVSRRILIAGNETSQPGHARFHETPDGTLYAVLYVSGAEAGNKLMQVYPGIDDPPLIPIPLKQPMGSFCLASVRAGNAPANTIDLFGNGPNSTMAYAQIRLH